MLKRSKLYSNQRQKWIMQYFVTTAKHIINTTFRLSTDIAVQQSNQFPHKLSFLLCISALAFQSDIQSHKPKLMFPKESYAFNAQNIFLGQAGDCIKRVPYNILSYIVLNIIHLISIKRLYINKNYYYYYYYNFWVFTKTYTWAQRTSN